MSWKFALKNTEMKKSWVRQATEALDSDFAQPRGRLYETGKPTQGRDFRKSVIHYLRHSLQPVLRSCSDKMRPFAHQDTMRLLVTPDGPCRKLLVNHRTGSGKTMSMVTTCNNFYFDSWPTIVLAPTKQTKHNFFRTLSTTPGPWKLFIEEMTSRFRSTENNEVDDESESADERVEHGVQDTRQRHENDANDREGPCAYFLGTIRFLV